MDFFRFFHHWIPKRSEKFNSTPYCLPVVLTIFETVNLIQMNQFKGLQTPEWIFFMDSEHSFPQSRSEQGMQEEMVTSFLMLLHKKQNSRDSIL